MNLEFLKLFALSGGNWVIYGLLAASVVAAAVIAERAIVLAREARALESLRGALAGPIAAGDRTSIAQAVSKGGGAASRILGDCLKGETRSAAEDRLLAATIDERLFLERRLLILGSLGSNSPFVGLFGTVLGVIKAFHDLALNAGAGPEIVMAGLSEALIATAVGLCVAIPCVVSYNYLLKRVSGILSGAESLSRRILSAGR